MRYKQKKFIYLIRIVFNQLIIQPNESSILRDQYKPFIALCSGQENIRVVSWESPSLIHIEENGNGRITVERKSYGLRLRIRNLTQNEQGIWKCLGFDQNGKSILNTLQINVKIPITFVSEPIQYAELNSNVLIRCRVIANPSAEISWFKGRDKINLLSSNYEQKTDGLKIYRVSSVDNDTFWCQADVTETGESKEYSIQVILAKTISSTRITCVSPCAVEKRTATLICEANGMPLPRYTWYYGEFNTFHSNGITKFVVRENRLIINYVDETDNGRYTCHAFNDYDKQGQRIDYNLNVIIPLQLSQILPIEISIDDQFPTQRVTFSCRVLRGSSTNLSLEWFYPNNTLVQSTDGISIDISQMMTHHLIELTFNSVRREHHGNYTCVGKNLGDRTSTIAQFLVKYKPVFISPDITHVYSAPGHQVTMKCRFDSYPPPIMRWIKLNTNHEENQMLLEEINPQMIEIQTKQIDSTIYQTELTYKPTEEDFGLKFQCQADNSRMEKHTFTLQRAELPHRVRIIEVEPHSTTINLTVQPPLESGGLPLLQYIVKYEQIDNPDSLQIISFPVLSNETQTIELKSLQVAHLYRIQIAVESHAGQSTFSVPVQAKTLHGDVPQFHLTNISCLNNQSYLIQWIIDNDGGSAISQIEISYAKVNKNNKTEQWSKPILLQPLINEYKLKDLRPKKTYMISVRLLNTAGFSERKTEKIIACQMYIPRSARISIIIGIIILILFGTILLFLFLVLNRVLWDRKCH
ncbi:unnamed protein product [Adineta ricciae]|uniref:Uncharacterized protein n=1 Tax=Adineta ricciae TaxID=249248 RepID=A0A815NNH3_ADIRI|nr:unnamed protein product [Adineta ricciae]